MRQLGIISIILSVMTCTVWVEASRADSVKIEYLRARERSPYKEFFLDFSITAQEHGRQPTIY